MVKELVSASEHREPQDRLTRMCDEMITVFENHAEHEEADKCMIFLDDGKRGGIVLHGYDDSLSAFVDLLLHLKAIFKANGKDLTLAFLNPDGSVDSV